MRTVTEHIRAHLERNLPRKRPSRDELLRGQWSPMFEQLMRNRLIVGACRYETFDEKRANNTYDIISSMIRRLELYRESGNLEHMVDVANLAMIEFECPTHDNVHWAPQDDGEHVEKR